MGGGAAAQAAAGDPMTQMPPPPAFWGKPPHHESVRPKDFVGIAQFDGEINKFPDWADRMGAKIVRMHPKMAAIIAWAERQAAPITEEIEAQVSDSEIMVISLSNLLMDILTERTGPRLYDKRKNAGTGRGLEFWRVLKRDFGMESSDAQLAKMQMFINQARCASTAALGEALDRWEALGREMSEPMSDIFKLVALMTSSRRA